VTVRDKDREQFKTSLDAAKAIVEDAKAEDRDLTADERDEVDGLTAKAEQAKARIEADAKDDTLALRLAALLGEDAKSDEPDDVDAKTLGEAFADSPAYKSWLASVQIDGEVPASLKNFRTPTVGVGRKFLNLAGVGSAFDSVDRRGVMVPEPWPRGMEALLALYSTGTTGSAVINYAIEDWADAADFVAEATASSGASGAKPESTVTYTPATVNVGTVAHWVAATKNALADVGQLRALIDNGLRKGLLRKVANATLNGDGAAPEWFGLNALAAITTQAYRVSPLATIKDALGTVENAGYDATAIVMNSADWAAIDEATPVVVTDPLQNRPRVIGGVQVIATPLQPAGFAMVGDFKAAFLLDREQAAITATDSHADFFIRNLVAILGEWRGAFFVPAPAAFKKADLTSA